MRLTIVKGPEVYYNVSTLLYDRRPKDTFMRQQESRRHAGDIRDV